mmetsp:Transcript_56067/g.133547  ORF Transcript_56067/g.133547 Transcript_56067/m.133547 type:complete len:256 (-) Transcript_56067:173-940(-)
MPPAAPLGDVAEVSARPAVGDPAKWDAMWKQLVGTEHRTYNGSPLQASDRRRLHEGFVWELRPSSSKVSPPGHPPRASSAPTLGAGLGGLDFIPGDVVTIRNMGKRTDLNGLKGTVIPAEPDNSGRVCVKLRPLTSGGSAKVVRVKPSRLQSREGTRPTAPSRRNRQVMQSSRPLALATSAGRLFISGDVSDVDDDVDHFLMNDRGRESMEFKLLEQHVTGARKTPCQSQFLCGHRGFERTPCGNFFGKGRVRAI